MNFQILVNVSNSYDFDVLDEIFVLRENQAGFRKEKILKNFSIISLKFFDKLHRLNKKLTYD